MDANSSVEMEFPSPIMYSDWHTSALPRNAYSYGSWICSLLEDFHMKRAGYYIALPGAVKTYQ